MKVVIDAGALIAVDKRDRRVMAMLRLLQQQRVPLLTSSAAVAQVWRDGRKQALLAHVLAGIDVRALSPSDDRRTGELLAHSKTNDVIDAHVATLVEDGDRVMTTDRGDLARLLSTRRVAAMIVAC